MGERDNRGSAEETWPTPTLHRTPEVDQEMRSWSSTWGDVDRPRCPAVARRRMLSGSRGPELALVPCLCTGCTALPDDSQAHKLISMLLASGLWPLASSLVPRLRGPRVCRTEYRVSRTGAPVQIEPRTPRSASAECQRQRESDGTASSTWTWPALAARPRLPGLRAPKHEQEQKHGHLRNDCRSGLLCMRSSDVRVDDQRHVSGSRDAPMHAAPCR